MLFDALDEMCWALASECVHNKEKREGEREEEEDDDNDDDEKKNE